MTDFRFRALCAELVSELFDYKVANPMHDRSLVNRACAELDETRGTGASAEQVAQIVYENAMLAVAPDHAKPFWPSWADLPNSDARAHALNTAEIIYALLGYTMAPDHVSLIDFAFNREPWATWLRKGGCLESAHCDLVDLMTAVLSRWGRPAPAPKPIPVSERPWEREGWCDAEGRCWFCNAYSMGKWTYETAPDSEQDWKILGLNTDSLPHWAIARPRPKVKEIES